MYFRFHREYCCWLAWINCMVLNYFSELFQKVFIINIKYLIILVQFIKYYYRELFIIMKNASFQTSPAEIYQPIATFVLKTYSILALPQNAQIIAWNPQGISFTIKDIKLFVNLVLPSHFRHRKYESFIRQLNMYNFNKLKNHQKPTFSNQYFRREREELLKFIHRKPEKKKRMSSDLSLHSASKLVEKPLYLLKQQVSTQIREVIFLIQDNKQNVDNQTPRQLSRKRKVSFKDQRQQSGEENYSTMMKPSSKWVNKDQSCWQQIKSFKSFKISMKLLEDAEDSVHSLKCVLAQPWNQTRASCNFMQPSTFKNITQ